MVDGHDWCNHHRLHTSDCYGYWREGGDDGLHCGPPYAIQLRPMLQQDEWTVFGYGFWRVDMIACWVPIMDCCDAITYCVDMEGLLVGKMDKVKR